MWGPPPGSPFFPTPPLFRPALPDGWRPASASADSLRPFFDSLRTSRDTLLPPGADTARVPTPGGSSVSRLVDRKSTRLNSSHSQISYAVFCLKKKKPIAHRPERPRRPNLAQSLPPDDQQGRQLHRSHAISEY